MSVTNYQHKRLIRAGELDDRHMGRVVRIGDVEGELIGLNPMSREVHIELLIGGSRALFALEHFAEVEVGGKP